MISFNQDIDTANVRRETHNGEEYLVAPITILKPMVLNTPQGEAYLPEAEAKKSAMAWNGIPLTLNHPSTSDGTPTTANSPGMLENVQLGRVFNARANKDGAVKAEAWFNIAKINGMGGPALNALNRVEDGKTVEVSSGYQADVASNQKADGKTRKRIQGNIRPDHVAVLPNDRGKCSVADGCGVGMAANTAMIFTNAEHQDVPSEYQFDNPGEAMEAAQELGFEDIHTHGEGEDTIFMPGPTHEELVSKLEEMGANADDGNTEESGMIRNYLSEARTPDFDGTETTSWGDVPKTLSHWTDALDVDAESVADMSMEQKNTVAAHTLLGDPEADTWGELRFFPVVNPSTGNLNEGALQAVISGRGESQESVPESAEDSAQEKARMLLEDEFDSENSGHMGEEEEEMSENLLESFINALKDVTHNEGAESSADTTEPMSDTDCTCNESEEDPEQAQNGETIEVSKDKLDALIDERVEERLAANKEQTERQQLVETITANSEDYTEESLEETPVDVLESLAANVQGGVDYGASRGASPKPATNSEEIDTDIKLFGSDA